MAEVGGVRATRIIAGCGGPNLGPFPAQHRLPSSVQGCCWALQKMSLFIPTRTPPTPPAPSSSCVCGNPETGDLLPGAAGMACTFASAPSTAPKIQHLETTPPMEVTLSTSLPTLGRGLYLTTELLPSPGCSRLDRPRALGWCVRQPHQVHPPSGQVESPSLES